MEIELRVREYGMSGRQVIILHGGPGAAGYLEPVARELADSFQILEPFQRRSGGATLTVARHVEDLHLLISGRGLPQPALVGHSWGAMLALAYAAAYPAQLRSITLIGCGTFDPAARKRLEANREQRMSASLRHRLRRLPEEFADADEHLRTLGNLMLLVDSCDPLDSELPLAECDARGHQETWADMLRLQEASVYPAAFADIREPVLMLHGAEDPHPGGMIREGLQRVLPQLEYREWNACGHYPWLERAVRDDFFAELHGWLAKPSLGSSTQN